MLSPTNRPILQKLLMWKLQLRARLMEDSVDPAPEERWPGIGERVRVRPLGLWSDGNLRLSGRSSFVDRMPRRHRWLGKRLPSES